jgi:hypothetical protein
MWTRNLGRWSVLSGVLVVLSATFAFAGPPHHHGGHKKCDPTREEKREAAEFVKRTLAETKKYETPMDAMENDFHLWVDGWKNVHHYINYDNYYDWRILDPKEPEALVYAYSDSGPQLIGIMYSMEDPDRKPPDMGGCITRWHTHPQCRSPFGYSHIWEEEFGDCPPGWEDDGGSEPMLHVWTVPMEGGPYAMHPDEKWGCWPRPAPCD